jgi:hypothetical protein
MISGNYKKISSFRVVERQQAAAARSRSLWGLSLIAGHAAVKLHPSSCSPAPLAAPGTAGPDCANQLPSCHRRQRGQLRGRRQCQNRCAAIRIGPLLSLVCVLLRLVVDDPQGIWRRTSNWWQRESHRRRCLLILLYCCRWPQNHSIDPLRPTGIIRRTPYFSMSKKYGCLKWIIFWLKLFAHS